MGVNVCGGADFCMAQAFRDGDNIFSAVDQDRGHCMPERMRVNVGEVVPLGKFTEPCGDPVRDHRLPVFLDKQESGILPAVAVLDLELHVPAAVLPEQLHCFSGELDKADGSGFGGVLIDPSLCRIKQIGVNINICRWQA